MSDITFTAYNANNSTVIYTLEKFYKAREVDPVVSKMQDRITALEAENAELRVSVSDKIWAIAKECSDYNAARALKLLCGQLRELPKQEATDETR